MGKRIISVFLAVVLMVSVIPLNTVAAGKVITAVNTEGLVTETFFPYSGTTSDPENRWSNAYSEVKNPVFYESISATVDGKQTDIPVTWSSDNYNSCKTGTYTFKAVAEGYTWECEVPEITVHVIDGVYNGISARFGLVSSTGDLMNPVIKASGVKNNTNQVYDATGYNKLYNTVDEKAAISGGLVASAGIRHNTKTISGKNPYTKATQGSTRITVTDGAYVTAVVGGNMNVDHNGDTYISFSNAKTKLSGSNGIYGGGMVDTAGKSANVTGDTHIDVSGKVEINKIVGGGWLQDEDASNSAKVTGTAYVTIHDLEEGSIIKRIEKGNAAAMVLDVDDPAVFEFVSSWEGVTAKVNGVEWSDSSETSGENKTITFVDVPVKETVIYSGTNVENLKFYSSLDCEVEGEKTKLKGFIWKSDDFNCDKAGVYTFKAKAPFGYSFSCEVPEISVRVKEGILVERRGYYISNDGEGLYAKVKGADETSNRLYDMTGCVELRNEASSDIGREMCLVGGVDTGKVMTTPTKSHIVMEGGAVTSMIGGSYGTNYLGTSIIEVGGGVLDNVYAGSVNGKYEGTTDIYISGNPKIGAINCDSVFECDAGINDDATTIVGTPDISYKGTVNIYFKADFSGEVSRIITDGADKVNIYIEHGAKINPACYNPGKNTTVYVNGKEQKNFVRNINYDGLDFVTVLKGVENVSFDGALSVYVNGRTVELKNVKWTSRDYKSDREGIYTFEPVIPAEYYVSAALEIPCVNVLVGSKNSVKVTNVQPSYATKTVIPSGIDGQELEMPESVDITFSLGDRVYNRAVRAGFSLDSYKTKEGTYTVRLLQLDEVFDVSASLLEKGNIVVKVSNDAKVEKNGDVYKITSATVKITSVERNNYKLTDISGIYTYTERADVIYSIYAFGTGVELDIDSDKVYIENEIDLNGISGTVKLNIPQAHVTKVRYGADIARKVYINGNNMSGVANINAKYDVKNKFFYANGIPVVIAEGEDGGTYAYRASDMKLLDSTNIKAWTVHGGTPAEKNCKTSNIALVSGVVDDIFAGGHGETESACVVLDGGFAMSLFGGANSGGTVRETTVVLEGGSIRERVYGGGRGTMGYEDKTYADNEYAIDIHVYDGGYLVLRIGGRDEEVTYGNIRMIQYGGVFLNVAIGDDSTIKGNFDATVYGGIWQKQYQHTSDLKGKSRLNLYRGIVVKAYETYPYILGDVELKFFDYDDKFEYTGYIQNREPVVSTEGDKGNLVVRLLETRFPDESKYSSKLIDGTGDCIYITFPDGKNMIVDTGEWQSAPTIIKTLKEIGVKKLDYLLITHNHKDHCGAVTEIAKVFDIDTFVLQPQAIWPIIEEARQMHDSEVVYLKRYDTMKFGNVEMFVINPSDPMQTDANQGSMAFVLTFGKAKVLLTGDCEKVNEAEWLEDPVISAKIKDCTVLKAGHHGIQSANEYKYVDWVNADKIIIPNMSEHGIYATSMTEQLTVANGYDLRDIHITGLDGNIKVTLDGTEHGVTVVSEYNRISSHYADYTAVENVIAVYDSFGFEGENLKKWNEAKNQVIYGLTHDKQNVADGIAEYLEYVGSAIAGSEINTATVNASENATFDDVYGEYKQSVELLASLGVAGGYADGTFRPDNSITRAEFSKLMHTAFGSKSAEKTDFFKDVSDKSWYAPHINWAYSNNVVGGYGNGTFLPENNVSRQEAIKMAVTCITDKSLAYPMGYMEEAKKAGLLDGLEVGAPDAPASRGWVAKLVANLLFKENRFENSPAVVSVFGLKEVTTDDGVAMLSALTGKDGQVTVRFHEKTAEGKAGRLISQEAYECTVDMSGMFGLYLKIYVNEKNEITAVTPV